MQYILTEEEKNNLVPKKDLDLANEKLAMLLREYRKIGCAIDNNTEECCDRCPIASLNNKLSVYSRICNDQELSQ
jgi:hypothetical protein